MTDRWLVWKSLQIAGRVLTTALFDLKVSGLEHIPCTGGALLVSNHQSYLDPVLLGARLHRPLSYVAKAELFDVTPTLTWLLHSVGAIPVHQGSSDVRAMRESIRQLREGMLLNLYPEGARTPDGEIGRIERGVALIVRRARVPVIPAVISGAFEAWPLDRRFPRPGSIYVRFGPPMMLTDLSDTEITAKIGQTLRQMLIDVRAESQNCDGVTAIAR